MFSATMAPLYTLLFLGLVAWNSEAAQLAKSASPLVDMLSTTVSKQLEERLFKRLAKAGRICHCQLVMNPPPLPWWYSGNTGGMGSVGGAAMPSPPPMEMRQDSKGQTMSSQPIKETPIPAVTKAAQQHQVTVQIKAAENTQDEKLTESKQREELHKAKDDKEVILNMGDFRRIMGF